MNQKTTCSLCSKEITSHYLITHIPQCYYTCCKENNITPFCCCNSCEGKCAHPNAITTPNSKSSSNSNSNSASSSSPIQSDPKNDKKPNPDQLQGITCFICDLKKEHAFDGVTITIGRYREIRLCKKNHIKNTKDRKALCENVFIIYFISFIIIFFF